MTQEEIRKFVEISEAQAACEEVQAKTLLTSSAHRRMSNEIILQLLEENKNLRQTQSITNHITNNFNAPVAQAISGVEQLSAPCQPSPSQTTSTPRLDSTLTTLTK